MDPFRGLGMPRIPGLSELLTILQTQTEALAQLPRTLSDLNGTVRELTEATTKAHATIASAQRIGPLASTSDSDRPGRYSYAIHGTPSSTS